MKKKISSIILCAILILALFAACSDDSKKDTSTTTPQGTNQNTDETQGSYTLTVNLNVTNPEEKDDSYLVHMLSPGKKETETGKATQSGRSKVYETDANGTVVIDIEGDWAFRDLVEHPESTKPNTLEVYVTTKEDIYIRNPLNTPTSLDFIIIYDDDAGFSYDCMFTQTELNLDITDKYPDGVLSLSFQDAVFVLKLAFDEPPTKNTYEVSLFVPNENTSDGIGIVRVGRLCRDFFYWDTQFYANEVRGKRAVVITDYETDQRIPYEGFPLWLDFNDDGTCVQGDIIVVNMPAGS